MSSPPRVKHADEYTTQDLNADVDAFSRAFARDDRFFQIERVDHALAMEQPDCRSIYMRWPMSSCSSPAND